MQTSGRGPGETVPLDKLAIEAESASAVPQLRAADRSTMPAPRQPGPLACTRVQIARCRTARPPHRGPWCGAVPP